MKRILRYIFLFLFLFIQPLSLGGMKVSYLTSGIILFYICIAVLGKQRNVTRVFIFSFITSIKTLLSMGFFYNFSFVLIDFFRSLLLPMIHLYAVNNWILKKAKSVLYNFSCFIILSSLPFLLNLISPLGEGYNLEYFGADSSGFIGFFENSHSASCCLAFSILYLVNILLLKRSLWSKWKEIFLLIVITIGVIALYKTYIRTGYLVLLSGVSVIAITKFSFRNIKYYILTVSLLAPLLTYIYINDSTFKNRLVDNAEYNSGSTTDDLGSGRLKFQIASMEIFQESSPLEKILGIGLEEYENRMIPKVSLKIYAHNGFMTSLVKDGLLGMLFFFLFIREIIISAHKSTSRYRTLSISFAYSYLSYQLVQGGVISPIMEFFIAVVLLFPYVKNKLVFNRPKSV